jgi:hypothetical protein
VLLSFSAPFWSLFPSLPPPIIQVGKRGGGEGRRIMLKHHDQEVS